jgi:hypothetical protein
MGKYSCPICEEDVSPVNFRRVLDGGIIVPNAEGVLTELKQCSGCGASLERTPLDRWHEAGVLESTRQLRLAGFR